MNKSVASVCLSMGEVSGAELFYLPSWPRSIEAMKQFIFLTFCQQKSVELTGVLSGA